MTRLATIHTVYCLPCGGWKQIWVGARDGAGGDATLDTTNARGWAMSHSYARRIAVCRW